MKAMTCPEIAITLENTRVNALIDTGSEITCISEGFYYANQKYFSTCPTLPISGKLIKGATGAKSTRLKFQVPLSTEIKGLKTNLIFIVVPILVKHCILGYDTHKAFSMLIDTRNEKILFTINEHYAQISFKKTDVGSKEHMSLRIEDSSDDEYDPQINHQTSREDVYEYDQSYDISAEEIDEKVNSCPNLSHSQREKIKHLIMRYKEVFQKRLGLL